MTLDSFQKYQLKGFGHEFYRFSSNGFFKDLSILGRADHNIVAIDLEKSRVLAPHQENCIILPKFTGSADDDSLTKLTPLLIRTFGSPRPLAAESQGRAQRTRKAGGRPCRCVQSQDHGEGSKAPACEARSCHLPQKFFQPTTN